MIEGDIAYEDTTGAKGVLLGGGVEWMQAGNGVWHDVAPANGPSIRGFQLCVALPASQENAPTQSPYLKPSQIPQEGPARALLGQYGTARSSIPAPAGMNYLVVNLRDGERWTYEPPTGHTVAWLAVRAVQLEAETLVDTGELAVFEESNQAIDIVARGDTSLVLGSAVKHPHDLVLGYYSVHTSEAALEQGETEIKRIGARLQQEGRLQ